MNANKATVLIATILTALAELGGRSREGIIYAALMNEWSLDEFHYVIGLGTHIGLLKKGPNFAIDLTDAGREMAHKVNAALALKTGAST